MRNKAECQGSDVVVAQRRVVEEGKFPFPLDID